MSGFAYHYLKQLPVPGPEIMVDKKVNNVAQLTLNPIPEHSPNKSLNFLDGKKVLGKNTISFVHIFQ